MTMLREGGRFNTMILVDIPKGPRESPQYRNQAELKRLIRAQGILCDAVPLQYGDAAMEGNGPDGNITIGIERKGLHDMLNCIDDAHFAGKQRLGMKNLYNVSILMIEGYWGYRNDGLLMESRDGVKWWSCRPHGRPVMYSKLRRYVMSMAYSGVIVNYTKDLAHTAYDICEIFHYHEKKWDDHTSLREIHKLAIPQLMGRPSLTRQWASCIEGVGVKLSEDAERMFRKPHRLANSDELDWIRIPGISVAKAQDIVRQIQDFDRRKR